MQVRVEVEYREVPPPEEMRAMRQVALRLTSDPSHISVYSGETLRHRPAIILEFEVPTQSQGKAVDRIFDTLHLYAGPLYSDLTVNFPKRRRRPRPWQIE